MALLAYEHKGLPALFAECPWPGSISLKRCL